jgi:hypothetical protein
LDDAIGVRVQGANTVKVGTRDSYIANPLEAAREEGKLQPSLWGRVDSRAMRVGMLLLAVLILNAMDLAYTMTAHQMGMLKEMNPIADGFFKAGLEPSLICFKILMVLCGTCMLWKLRSSRWVVPACWLLVITYAALGLVWYDWVQNITVGMEVANAEWVRHGHP